MKRLSVSIYTIVLGYFIGFISVTKLHFGILSEKNVFALDTYKNANVLNLGIPE